MRQTLTLEFRVLFIAILGVIVPFGLLLYFLPGGTDFYWAWAIPEPRSAILIGAGYSGGIFYYLFALRDNDWQEVENSLGGLILFTVVLLVATMAHWDTFKPYHPITLVWLAFYYGGPLLVPILYRLQIERMGVAGDEGVKISPAWRAWLRGRGVVYAGLALAGLVFAAAASAAWPWPIQPLELRVFMGQVAAVSWSGLIAFAGGQAWRRFRLGLLFTAAIGLIQLLGLLIGPASYQWSSPLGVILPLMFAEWIVTPLLMFAAYRKPSR